MLNQSQGKKNYTSRLFKSLLRALKPFIADINVANLPYGASAIVFSPPFARSEVAADKEFLKKVIEQGHIRKTRWGHSMESEYAPSDDNIGGLPYGTLPDGGGLEVSAVVFSPPYCEANRGGGIAVHGYDKDGKHQDIHLKIDRPLSDSPDNLSNLEYGSIDAIVTSPPYSEQVSTAGNPQRRAERMREAGLDPKTIVGGKARCDEINWRYSASDKNINLDLIPTMTLPISKRQKEQLPLFIDLDMPLRYPIKCTGDFRDGVVTVGTWAMGRRTAEFEGKKTDIWEPTFIVVYFIPEKGTRGYVKVEGNEIRIPNPKASESTKEPLDLEFILTEPLEIESVRTWMTPPAVKAFTEGKTLEPLEVYKRAEDYYRTYVDFAPDPRRYNIMALADVATYFYRIFPAFPRFHIFGPQESGKERASRCFAYLSWLGIFEVNPTEAAMFRLAECQVTQAIDEAERFYQTGPGASEVAPQRALINTGYQEGARVPRVMDEVGNMRKVKWYDAYSPMTLASIRDLGRVTRSRFIGILMRRTVVSDFSNRAPSEKSAGEIRNDLYMLRLLHAHKVAEMKEKLDPAEFDIKNRSWELWRPLLVVAKALGLPHEDTVSFIKEWEGHRRREELTEDDVMLLKVLHNLTSESPDENLVITNAELVSALVEEGADQKERKYMAQRIGYMVRNFGFQKARPDPKGPRIYKIPKKEIKDLWASYAPGDSMAIAGFSQLMGKAEAPQKEPEIEHILDTFTPPPPPHKPAKVGKSMAIACAKCGATDQGIEFSTDGTPLCPKCSREFKGEL